ncbi:T9SS type A sorting domain-containing protein [Gaetbulibacter sp. M240]|uniref:T9SS type A sorting domain-containing protein n=1 Tax=Gaetbulibacter sp. M240 TaxID=3126511 RepID=UPI00374E9830
MNLKIILTGILMFQAVTFFGQGTPADLPKADLYWSFDAFDTSGYGAGYSFSPTSPSGRYTSNIAGSLDANNNVVPENSMRFEVINPSNVEFSDHIVGNSQKGISDSAQQSAILFSIDDDTEVVDKGAFWGLASEDIIGDTPQVDGITISLWVRKGQYLDPNKEHVLIGATNATDLQGNTIKPSYVDTKFGLSLKGNTLYFKMYNSDDPEGNGTAGTPWKYEIWDPGSLDAGPGWYRIFLVMAHTQKYMQIIISKPNSVTYGNSRASFNSNYAERVIWMPGVRGTPFIKGEPVSLANPLGVTEMPATGHFQFQTWFLGGSIGIGYDELKLWNKALSSKTIEKIIVADGRSVTKNDGIVKSSIPITTTGNQQNPNQEIEETNQSGPEEWKDKNLKLYPNPNDGNFTLNYYMEKSTDVKVKIFSILGQVVFEKDLHSEAGKNTLDINLSNISSGLYTVWVNDGEWQRTSKVLIK